MKNSLKVLVLEDDIIDVELISRVLEKAGMTFTITIVNERLEFEAAISNYRFDVILADNSLPQFDAVSALRIIQQKNMDTPFILVTGTVSEEFAVDVIHKGANDYILKGNLKKLPSAIDSAIAKWEIKKEKAQAEKALRESEQRFRILFEQAADGIVISDTRGCLIDANISACNMIGYSFDELKKMNIRDTFFGEDLETQPIRMEELLSGKAIISERKIRRKDQTCMYVELSAKLLTDRRLQVIARDVSYRKQLESQFQDIK
jgi:PAS domain S-box-containing protein